MTVCPREQTRLVAATVSRELETWTDARGGVGGGCSGRPDAADELVELRLQKRSMQVVKERCQDSGWIRICCVWHRGGPCWRPRRRHWSTSAGSTCSLEPTWSYNSCANLLRGLVRSPHVVPASFPHPLGSISSSSDQSADSEPEGHRAEREAPLL